MMSCELFPDQCKSGQIWGVERTGEGRGIALLKDFLFIMTVLKQITINQRIVTCMNVGCAVLLQVVSRGITPAWLHKLSNNDSIPPAFRDKKYQSSTALSKHIWSLKDKDTNFEIKWEVRKKATEYQNTTGRCNLCVAEKLVIIRADKKTSLNKRSELVSKCRHENRYYLCNFPPPIPWSLYLTCLSTNMSLNTVSSEPHISFYDHLNSPVLCVSLASHLFVFSPVFFPVFSLCFISHCSSHWFFSLFFFTLFSLCFPPILTLSHPSQHCPTPSHPYLSKVLRRLFCVFAWRSASAMKLLVANTT